MKKSFFNTIVCLTLFLFALTACHTQSSRKTPVIRGYSDEPLINGLGLDMKDVRIIPLETSKESALSHVVDIGFFGDNLLVQDAGHRLLCFDRQGHFLFPVGMRGRGNGEYLRINAFAVNESDTTVTIFDETSGRIITYDAIGELLESVRLDGKLLYMLQRVAPIPNDERGDYLCSGYVHKDYNRIYSLLSIKNSFCQELQTTPMKTRGTAEIIGIHPINQYGGRLSLILPFSNSVFEYLPEEKKIVPRMTVSVGPKTKLLSQKQISRIDNYSIMLKSEFMAQNYFPGFSSLYETNDYIYLDMDGRLYFLIDKNNNTGVAYEGYIGEIHPDANPLISVKLSDGNSFVGMLEPWRIKTLRNQFDAMIDCKELSLFYKAMMALPDSCLEDGNNPCLVFYQL